MFIEVFIPTYNHEKFIEKAISGVMEQKTSHPYKIVISDDCSTDSTIDIIRQIADKHPDFITVIQHPTNVGMMMNYYNYLNSTTADIILFCEGDDYWIDNTKLEKQVCYLMEYEKCAVVFCSTSNIKDDTEEQIRIAKDVGGKGRYYLNDILPHNTLNTLSSVAIKNVIKNNYPAWYKQCNTPDGPLYFALLGDQYYIDYMDFIGTNYRIGAGTWSSLNKIDQQKSSIETYEILKANLSSNNTKACKLSILKSLLTLAKEYRTVDRKESFKYCKAMISYDYWGIKKWLYIAAIPLIYLGLFE